MTQSVGVRFALMSRTLGRRSGACNGNLRTCGPSRRPALNLALKLALPKREGIGMVFHVNTDLLIAGIVERKQNAARKEKL